MNTEFTELYFEDDIITYGALCYLSNIYAMTQFSLYDAERFYTRVHFFGDCSTPIIKKSITNTLTNFTSKPQQRVLLFNNYPNPFNPETTIRFDIPTDDRGLKKVKLTIYNELGQLIERLYEGPLDGGQYEMKWHGSNQPSGMYILHFHSQDFVQSRKMVLVR